MLSKSVSITWKLEEIIGLLGEGVTQHSHVLLALCSLAFTAYEVPVEPCTIVFLYGEYHCKKKKN